MFVSLFSLLLDYDVLHHFSLFVDFVGFSYVSQMK